MAFRIDLDIYEVPWLIGTAYVVLKQTRKKIIQPTR